MISPSSNPEVRRFLSTPEVEALKLWAIALALVLFAVGIYVIGEGVMSALAAGGV